MITEDYVNFEIAKLLKEKGFDEPCRAYWDDQPVLNSRTLFWTVEPHKHYDREVSAPTHQMAMKWLREEKGICIVIYPYDSSHKERYEFEINERVSEDPYMWESYMEIKNTLFEGYNTCVEAALKYSLENLI